MTLSIHTPKGEPIEVVIARMEEKLDALLLAGEDREKRLRSVEKKVAWVWGVGAVVAFFGTWLWTTVLGHLTKSP